MSPPASSVLDPAEEIASAREEMRSGRAALAVRRLQELIASTPLNPLQTYWLAAAQGAAGDRAGHVQSLRQAEAFHALKVIKMAGGDLVRLQHDPVYATEVGKVFGAQGLMGVAAVGFGRGAMSPDAPLSTTISYGQALFAQGRLDEAVAAFSWVLAANPGSAAAQAHLAEALICLEDGLGRQAEAARGWRRFQGDGGHARPPERRVRAGRPLRVGYLAGALQGPVLRRLGPVLDHHDPDRVQAIVYVGEDAEAAQAPARAIRNIGALGDEAAAELIRSDGIDVLVDLCGAGVGGRLGVVMRRPAPVQAAWLDRTMTSGAPEVDVLLHDDFLDAEAFRAHCAERLCRIGPGLAPVTGGSPVETAPSRAAGRVTFGACDHPAQLSDRTLDAWGRILGRVAGSRLVLGHGLYRDDILQNSVLMRLAARGVEPDRVAFPGASREPAQAWAEVDLALEPFPSPDREPGLAALAAGVPLLALEQAGDWRSGAKLARTLGLDGLVTRDWDAYVGRAADLAADVEALEALRRRVIAVVAPLRDAEGFTRRLEAALEDLSIGRGESRLERTAA